MTPLTKPLTRLVPDDRRPLRVTLEPSGLLTLCEKGHRKGYTINLHTLYVELVKKELS